MAWRVGVGAVMLMFLGTPIAAAPPPAPAPAPVAELVRAVDIPFETFTLANGLKVVVHTDRKTPIVAVSVWYHIGSKDEPAGKTGFAHLFEHLMFYGSENNDGVFFKPLEEIGATDANGTTWFDRTNYFENVPTPALDLALFLESDRMGHLLGAVTQAKLDAQRGVVQNEKRQGDNEPYGLVEYALLEGLFPAGHPYRHSSIGSMADLDAASLTDVRDWFRANYAPGNAVLALAGDIDAATARPLVEKYFGAIPAGPPPRRFDAPVPRRTATTRRTMRDAVSNPRLYRSYVAPGRLDASAPLVDIAATILAGGNSSRLYNDLVRDRQLAVAVGGGAQNFEKVSLVQFTIDVKPGVDSALVEKRVDELFAQFLSDGPTADEVGRVATRAVAGTIRGLEAVGGFGGKATALAEGLVYAGDAGFYKTELRRYADATPATVKAAANAWLARGEDRITVLPGDRTPLDIAAAVPGKASAPTGASAPPLRTLPIGQPRAVKRPAVTAAPELDFPTVERATLANGLPVTLARRASVPLVRMTLSFDAGHAADPRDRAGTQSLLLALVDEGTARRTGPEIAQAAERLGAGIGASATQDRTRLSLDALKPNLAASLELFADVVRNPAFAPAELERVRGQALAGIARELSDPSSLARRELPPLVYGAAHPYGGPGTGSGTIAGVKAVTRADLQAFQARWLRPDNGALFVVGDITMAELKPLLDAALGDWAAPAAPKGTKAFATVAPPSAARVILYDRPGSPQSVIRAGVVLPRTGRDDPVAISAANDMLGGLSTSRLSMNIRETKNWAYGAGSGVSDVVNQVMFIATAPVQTDRTADSIEAMREEIAALASGQRPITQEELDRVIANATRSLPGDFESGGGVLAGVERIAVLGRPDDWYDTLAPRTRALTPATVNAAATALSPDKLTWVVVGDRKLVEPQLRKLGLPLEIR